MVQTITAQMAQGTRERDIGLYAGETLRIAVSGLPAGAECVVSIALEEGGATLLERRGTADVTLDAAALVPVPTGRTCVYNLWVELGEGRRLLQHGAFAQRRSVAPTGTPAPLPPAPTGPEEPVDPPAPPLVISGRPAGDAEVGIPYLFVPSVSGGVPGYGFAVNRGELPAGITLDAATGLVSGVPSQAGAFLDIVIEVTDTAGARAQLAPFDLVVSAAPVVPVPDLSVAFASLGQSNADGTNGLNDVPDAAQGVFDRVLLADARHISDPASYADFYPLTVVKSGETVDGVAGPVAEARGGGEGVSSIFGMAQFVSDDPAGSTLFPDVAEVLIVKRAVGGQAQSAFAPGGGQFNTYDAMMVNLVPDKLTARETRWTHIEYAQGEREARLAVQAAESALGTTDWRQVVPAALTDPLITDWAESQIENRRAVRAQLGQPDLPYVFKGMVLPGDSGDGYADAQERVREGVAQAQKDLSRWLVRLSPDETGITLTDLAGDAQSVSWDESADGPVLGARGPAVHRDDATYYIDASGYPSNDSLHHQAESQMKIGRATRFLLEHLYGPGGVPGANRTVQQLLPYFASEPQVTEMRETGATLTLTASETGQVHLVAVPQDAAAPSAAAIRSGGGAASQVTASTTRRAALSVNLEGLTADTGYDVYALLDAAGVASLAVGPMRMRTVEAEMIPPDSGGTDGGGTGGGGTGGGGAPTGFAVTDLPGLALALNARALPLGPITDESSLTDPAGSTITAVNVDGGPALCEITQEIGGTKTLLVRADPANRDAGGRQRIEMDHGDLGEQFVMAALVQRDAPSKGQRIAIGGRNSYGGVRAVFYYADKSAAGGYGSGRQWGLAQVAPIAENDTDVHLMVIVSDGTRAGTGASPRTRVFVDGLEGPVVGDPAAMPSWQSVTRIGNGASSTNDNYDLRFTDLVFLRGTLADDDRARLEGRMAHDANRTDLLPAGHPYKAVAP